MESKIEKIEGAYDIPILKDKLNRVIDYLNSQDQEEICTHDFDLNNRCTKCGVRGVKDMIAELQDTPEEKEEWEKRFIRRFGYWGEEIKFIKQLLDERKREVLEEAKKIIDEEKTITCGKLESGTIFRCKYCGLEIPLSFVVALEKTGCEHDFEYVNSETTKQNLEQSKWDYDTGVVVGYETFRRQCEGLYKAFNNRKEPRNQTKWEEVARLFHDTYERLAPKYGYETREDTKEFNPESPNGKLMIAVCKEVLSKFLSEEK